MLWALCARCHHIWPGELRPRPLPPKKYCLRPLQSACAGGLFVWGRSRRGLNSPAAAAPSGVIPSTSRASLETLEETIDETRTADGTASHIRSYLTHGGRRQRPALPEELSEIKKIKQENETKRVQRVIAERSSVLASFHRFTGRQRHGGTSRGRPGVGHLGQRRPPECMLPWPPQLSEDRAASIVALARSRQRRSRCAAGAAALPWGREPRWWPLETS
jgi:hypothetical protein